LFECELALELGMSLSELRHGRGTPMSAHELGVEWPAFYAYRRREAERQAERQRHKQRGRR
jgi:hypothetical protein